MFYLSVFAAFGAWLFTLPARAKLPRTLPMARKAERGYLARPRGSVGTRPQPRSSERAVVTGGVCIYV